VLALGIDTSTPMVSVALERWSPPSPGGAGLLVTSGPQTVGRRAELAENAHGEVLAMLMADVLRQGDVAPSDLDAIGVGLGPGPFTGLRVGVVTAAAMSDAIGIPAYGMCSLDTITDLYADDQLYAVVSDARRRQVYWAVYDEVGRRVDGPEISTPDDLAAHLRGRVRRLIGPAAQRLSQFSDLIIGEPRWPDASVLAADALVHVSRGDEPTPLTPLYLRRPDAREPGPPKRVTPA
jgi:tRNA threonylcarbamoyl adenosine modification protein YeaZ